MSASSVLTVSDDLPLVTARPVHSGKVRSVYFLRPEDSRRLIEERGYAVAPHSDLAIMVISDRLSAFDCLWRSHNYHGVPAKGAALNAIAAHWFSTFDAQGLTPHHLLEMPHPMVWIVRQARPVMIEAIARRYITGSLWRAYARGERLVGGVRLSDGLEQFQRLPELLFTPSTKGVIRNVPGVPETDDAPLAPAVLREHHKAFALHDEGQLDACVSALHSGFEVIEDSLAARGDLLVDTKFEFGIAPSRSGGEELIYMDEVGTPDSSRIWRRDDWEAGHPREHSKEQFRDALLSWVDDRELLLDSRRMEERAIYARNHAVPDEFFLDLSNTYVAQAENILGASLPVIDRPRDAMLDLLNEQFGLVR
ncbi:phosphoribosylaminoimidazolesuccinocarboxamide synthase [Congregibacter litoralis]|uniref:Phosphoribosylaminoimidazole-succinocarboxamide synthase n=1 Tax=Congregibacter litoralis KT71 TaxID=314285 RepID=A4A3S9_9GAMM|nr:phosphoribosylaminoimidazolesuccinocarboxamide synthase [Congregibacter litoralis]EAQ99352.1 phosphoribosylaminoimidazole-succinocarboxamide synthase, Vibrio type [Congregibacter litoralis KT71]